MIRVSIALFSILLPSNSKAEPYYKGNLIDFQNTIMKCNIDPECQTMIKAAKTQCTIHLQSDEMKTEDPKGYNGQLTQIWAIEPHRNKPNTYAVLGFFFYDDDKMNWISEVFECDYNYRKGKPTRIEKFDKANYLH